ncbi:hypothetical protein SAMN05421736_10597 [Evansella caseinilytica]|uniref:Cytochrome C and Quinol oxidase polypeptide I n=1 Tax=Evansella caseinilytica TaxID=1503961 RepID=A0A1H3PLB2_9BACI|nr:hypothetical protein [Evansella caseinilytica]SDZ01783.1 hypothetical protein SAMN05421736_10597 [Evansella caseinilytica]
MQGLQLSPSAKASEQFILPFSFIITSFFALVVFSVSIVVTPDAFQPNVIRLPAGLSLVHLFILGWATMLAMGAVYQLIAVVTQQPLYSTKLGYVHYALYTVGVFGLFLSLSGLQLFGMIIFGSLTVVGVLVFLANVLMTIYTSRQKNPVITATKSALFYLGLTVLTGIIMVLNFRFSFLGSFHSSILITHLWAGLIGWFLFLIIGYSFKMLPMFYLAHGHSETWAKSTLIFLHGTIAAGSITAIIGKATALLPVCLGLLSTALWLFIKHTQEIRKKRFKKNPGKGIIFFVLLVYMLAGTATVLFAASLVGPDLILSTPVLTAVLFFYLFGFVHLSIASYLSKIIPFLWWTFRYGNEVGKKETPSLATMIDEEVVWKKLVVQLLALILFIAGLFISLPAVNAVTASLFAFSLLYYLFTVGKVFTY